MPDQESPVCGRTAGVGDGGVGEGGTGSLIVNVVVACAGRQ